MKYLEHIRYEIPEMATKWPLIIIGAGGIVKNAHLPAYKLAGLQVAGICDVDRHKAAELGTVYNIPAVYDTIQQVVQQYQSNCIYDVAVPGAQLIEVIRQLPDNSFVLMQKPMGENLQQAEVILECCRQKNITAAVNFQLRYAPYVLMAKQILAEGWLGEICNVEVYVNTYTPWHLWDFLMKADRLEILYHSIHYIDLMRNLLGNPRALFASSTKHPAVPHLQAVRSDIIMNYGDFLRVGIFTNHMHYYNAEKQEAHIKIEGTKGAIKIKLGLLLDYPHGKTDQFEYILNAAAEPNGDAQWQVLPVNGSWFPHAFIGSINELIKTRNGEISQPDNSVEDCIDTMRWVERAYGGV